ncbi:MAG: hypothetical protein ACSHXL_03380 [Bacteroidota bacterium]
MKKRPEDKKPFDKLKGQKDKLQSYFKRCGVDTPPFLKKLRIIRVAVAAAGATLLAAPVALPAAIITVGGYLVVGGAVATAMSQAAIAESNDCDDDLDGTAPSGI